MPTPALASLLALSLLGSVNAGYLIYKHYHKKPLVCPINHNCSVVTESKWSHIFFVKNEILGFLFFVGFFLLGLISVYATLYQQAFLFFLFVIGSAIGVLFSLFLIGIQIFAIKDYCFYCIISAIITLLVFVNSVVLYL